MVLKELKLRGKVQLDSDYLNYAKTMSNVSEYKSDINLSAIIHIAGEAISANIQIKNNHRILDKLLKVMKNEV